MHVQLLIAVVSGNRPKINGGTGGERQLNVFAGIFCLLVFEKYCSR